MTMRYTARKAEGSTAPNSSSFGKDAWITAKSVKGSPVELPNATAHQIDFLKSEGVSTMLVIMKPRKRPTMTLTIGSKRRGHPATRMPWRLEHLLAL